ncbi:MAG: PTS transporter subunit EIIC [Bifidobacteriaceae bacterium]|nr:PTS transporter subunit EIIC [Bifidobacteriaceae bacterium]
MGKYSELAKVIVANVGGKDNISGLTHHADKLRFVLKDERKGSDAALRKVDGVANVVKADGGLELVIGNHVSDVYENVMQITGTLDGQIAIDVLETIGGKENVTHAAHCMTRLRLNLKDNGLANLDAVKEVDGVLGAIESGGQLQIIIGQNVPKVYKEFVARSGVEAQASIDEVLDDVPKEKLTLKTVGNNILNYLSGSFIQLIPVLIAAAMFKTVLVLLGPDMLQVITAEDDLYILMNFLYEAGFYFLPIYLGYCCATKIGVTPILGMYMGGVLIAPSFIAMVTSEEITSFTVYGIPTMLNNYSQSVLPILLSVWVMSYVEKFFKKQLPDVLSTIFAPFLTMVVMVPVSLCALAPVGAYLGDTIIAQGLLGLGNVAGFLAVAVIAALWEYLVMSGMHTVLIVTGITMIMSEGSEGLVLPAGHCATWAAFGMALGAFIATRDRREKSLSLGYFVSGIIGGITEPVLYGVGFRYKKPFIAMSIGAAIGGLYFGITGVTTYVMGATNFLSVLAFVGGGTENLVNGVIGTVLSIGISAVLTIFVMRPSKKELAESVEV